MQPATSVVAPLSLALTPAQAAALARATPLTPGRQVPRGRLL